ncbi:hypothetical protein ISN44_As13g002600 [Arabidopsis suecica]|uniref:Uncharacterized protein n=1 Tax=Arabidopsis suecica TaxID=45249 RepID=A0A8T1XWK8_ARASU|nr:hypothetical protein ISN44_As13g002600 [Arabidopsis suecica]
MAAANVYLWSGSLPLGRVATHLVLLPIICPSALACRSIRFVLLPFPVFGLMRIVWARSLSLRSRPDRGFSIALVSFLAWTNRGLSFASISPFSGVVCVYIVKGGVTVRCRGFSRLQRSATSSSFFAVDLMVGKMCGGRF